MECQLDLNRIPLDLLKSHGSERWLINQGQTVVIINGGHGLMGGTLWELSKLMIFIDHLGNGCFLKFSMINLNLKYNNDDIKSKKQMEINRIGNKHCWKKMISELVVD